MEAGRCCNAEKPKQPGNGQMLSGEGQAVGNGGQGKVFSCGLAQIKAVAKKQGRQQGLRFRKSVAWFLPAGIFEQKNQLVAQACPPGLQSVGFS